jgi:WD40 repeat protein
MDNVAHAAVEARKRALVRQRGYLPPPLWQRHYHPAAKGHGQSRTSSSANCRGHRRGTVSAIAASLGALAFSPSRAGIPPDYVLADSGIASRGVNAVAFSQGGTTLAAGDTDGRIYLWSTATATSPTVLNGCANNRTYLWDPATRTVTATLTEPGGNSVSAVAFAPNGTMLAAGSSPDATASDVDSTYLWRLSK